eukprot:1156526-Pelagomonas_calceolata.AAC.6
MSWTLAGLFVLMQTCPCSDPTHAEVFTILCAHAGVLRSATSRIRWARGGGEGAAPRGAGSSGFGPHAHTQRGSGHPVTGMIDGLV